MQTNVEKSQENYKISQIWILPDRKGAKPTYAERSFAGAATEKFHLVASQSGRDGSIPINQDVDVFVGKLGAGDKISHPLRPGRHGWLQVAEGRVELNGLPLQAGDGAALSEEPSVRLAGKSPAQVLFFDLN